MTYSRARHARRQALAVQKRIKLRRTDPDAYQAQRDAMYARRRRGAAIYWACIEEMRSDRYWSIAAGSEDIQC